MASLNATDAPYFVYALYDDCWYQNDLFPPNKTSSVVGGGNSMDEGLRRQHPARPLQTHRNWYSKYPHSQLMKKGPKSLGEWQNGLADYPCGGPAALFEWLGHPDVKKMALHVDPNATMFSGDNGIGFVYKSTEKNLLPFYS